MIKFRQKNFFWGTAAMIGSSVIGVHQGSKGNEIAEESNRQQMKEMKRHNEAMEAAAKKNPAAALNAEEGQKVFASIVTTMARQARRVGNSFKSTSVGGLVSDFAGTQSGNIKKAVGMGASFAGIGYLGNRMATSVKDSMEGNHEENKNFLKKAAITGAVAGGAIFGARRGMMGKTAQNFMTTGAGGKVLKSMNPIDRISADKAARLAAEGKNVKVGSIDWKGTLGKNAMTAGFAAMPTVSYLASRKKQQDQTDNTQQEEPMQGQKSFANVVTGFLKTADRHITRFAKRPTSYINSAASHLGFYGQGGTKAVQNTGQKLVEAGQKSGNKFTQKVGEWITKKDANGRLVNEGKANLLAAGGTIAAGAGAMKVGSALVDTPAKAFDGKAYKFGEEQNDQV